jgi:hypothetical protein
MKTQSPPTTLSIDDWRELARRENHGLAVSLHWSKKAAQVRLTVVDSTSGEEFELPVAGPDALEAFHHPFAYIAGRGRSGAGVRTSLHLQPQG